jgi:vanillin dehydrogenase
VKFDLLIDNRDTSAQMPLGGLKASGYGRFGGLPGINEFTEVQWGTIEDPAQHYPI